MLLYYEHTLMNNKAAARSTGKPIIVFSKFLNQLADMSNDPFIPFDEPIDEKKQVEPLIKVIDDSVPPVKPLPPTNG